MKVLLVNKYFYHRGGDTTVFFATAELLQKKGHIVGFFSMDHPNNIPSEYSDYFVGNVDFDKGGKVLSKVKMVLNILYSYEAKKKMKRLVKEFKPDVVHLHNICHQISPSIIDVLKKLNIPIVMTLHDYKITCPNYKLYTQGKICDKCKGGRYYNTVANKCIKNSLTKSLIGMFEMYLHHPILRIYEKVDIYIAPSMFLKNKIQNMGFRGKVVNLPNFINMNTYPRKEAIREPDNKRVLYFGRLSHEKGINTLIEAVKGKDILLHIAGDGPLRKELKLKLMREKIHNVNLVGFKSGEDLLNEIEKSMFVVVPSEWHEMFGLVVIESFAMGRAVVASSVGGMSELINDNRGLTFEPGNAEDMWLKIEKLLTNREECHQMGLNGRRYVEKNYDEGNHYESLMDIYKKSIENTTI